jgi:putative ATP-binding cassette transporter
MLDQSTRWDLVLNEGEQQSLAFARVLLHAPRWLIIDEAFEAVEEEQRTQVREILTKHLPQTGILYIGRAVAHDSFYGRVLHLVNDTAGLKLAPKKALPEPAMTEAPAAVT